MQYGNGMVDSLRFPSPIGPLLAAAESIRDPGLPRRMVSSVLWKELECGFLTVVGVAVVVDVVADQMDRYLSFVSSSLRARR